jgi:hypothetical protein
MVTDKAYQDQRRRSSSVMVSRGTSENTVMNSEKAVTHEHPAKRNRH